MDRNLPEGSSGRKTDDPEDAGHPVNPDPHSGSWPARDTPAIRRAHEYGIDISLLAAMLDLSVEERLRRLDANLRFSRALRIERDGP